MHFTATHFFKEKKKGQIFHEGEARTEHSNLVFMQMRQTGNTKILTTVDMQKPEETGDVALISPLKMGKVKAPAWWG